ncbi:MAG: hypothetical protein HOF70_17110 [Rhodospirillaceae bacterium]|nr:hypothetical protein [Rhodospirillaceae bacterium]MBT3886506.1 hypothetical protein [Rhodospirillaceae bacterium]MBT4116192.1 hypothetical protein [Rhodospirillaceae bacterium]MBT4672131.1 hypothetical protein [Rhodospirillaceae bacterium]MBT4718161.1 hypothetical protein [Rhodospirillaceae bacterium]
MRLGIGFVTIVVSLVLIRFAVAADSSSDRSPNGGLASIIQHLVGSYTSKHDLVAIRETIRFSLSNGNLVIVNSARKRLIRVSDEKISVKDIGQLYRVKITELSSRIDIQTKWKSLFRSRFSGSWTAALVLRCKSGACFERTENVSIKCVSGCLNGSAVVEPETKEFTEMIHIPMNGRDEALRVGAILAKIIAN